jgi:predicted nucleic acid-binding protein
LIADSSAWIAYFQGRRCPETDHVYQALVERSGIFLIPPVSFEVLAGFRDDHSYASTERLFRLLPMIELTADTYYASARLYRNLRKKGITPGGPMDCLIAQACIENNTPLLTLDKDFTLIARHSALKLA